MDVAVTLKCLYLRAFILSLVVIPNAAICRKNVKSLRQRGGVCVCVRNHNKNAFIFTLKEQEEESILIVLQIDA